MQQGFLTFIFSILLANVGMSQELQSLDWLIGEWSLNQDGKTITESWSKANDSTLIGESKITSNGIEQFSESLSIQIRNHSINYVAVLPSKTAVFPIHEMKDLRIVFLDPENDFPSEIVYEKTQLGLDIILTGNKPLNPHREVLHLKKKR